MTRSKRLDREALERVCYSAARHTMWAQQPVDIDRIQAVADSLCKRALDYEEFIVEAGRDPNIIIRCVEYLARTHAIPPMRDDTRWFTDMFEALIEFAVPNTAGNQDSDEFYRDIEMGIATSREDFEESSS